MQRDKIKFPLNQPTAVRLQNVRSRTVNSGYDECTEMFVTEADEVMFVPPYIAERILQLGVQAGETIVITKRKDGWTVDWPKQQEPRQPHPTRNAAAAAPINNTTSHEQPNPNATPLTDQLRGSIDYGRSKQLSQLMAHAYCAAIDAVRVAQEYATSQGVNFRQTTGEIRASAHCIFIELGKAKDRDIREKEFDARYPRPHSAPRPIAANGGGNDRWPRQ